jgi:hypothetical protein
MSQTQISLLIGTPCYGGQVTSQYANSLLGLQQACWLRGIRFGVVLLSGDALITRARQNIVAQFLAKPDTTHLLFIDADIGFAPEQAFRLLDFGAELSAAIYPTKSLDSNRFRPIAANGKRDAELNALSYVIQVNQSGGITVRNGFIKVNYAGTGFLMIQRNALLAMIERYPELRYTADLQSEDPLRDSAYRSALFNCMIDEATGIYLSEDYSFCKRWTDMGGEIWADIDSRLDHVGSYVYSGHYRRSVETRQAVTSNSSES